MKCSEFEKKTEYFMNRELSAKDVSRFIEHIEGCRECRNEFEIKYIIEHGLSNNELLESYDFISIIDNVLKSEKFEAEHEQNSRKNSFIIWLVTNIIIIGCIVPFISYVLHNPII